jgi:hypothetical protein
MRRLRAEHIAAKYIEVGSKRQINISSAMRHTILDGVRPPVTATANSGTSGSSKSGSNDANMSVDRSKQGVKSRLQIGGFTSMTSLDSGNTTGTTTATTTGATTSGRTTTASTFSGRKATTTTTTAAAAAAATAVVVPVTAAVADDNTTATTATVAEVSDTDAVCTQSEYDCAAVWTPSLNVFDVAQKEVLHLMKQNLWLKFTASPLYNSLVRQVSKRATIGVMVKAGKISNALVQGATKHQQQ